MACVHETATGDAVRLQL